MFLFTITYQVHSLFLFTITYQVYSLFLFTITYQVHSAIVDSPPPLYCSAHASCCCRLPSATMHQMSELSNNSAIELRLALTSDQAPTVRQFGSSAEGQAVSHPTSHWMRCVAMLCCVLLNYFLLLRCWFAVCLCHGVLCCVLCYAACCCSAVCVLLVPPAAMPCVCSDWCWLQIVV